MLRILVLVLLESVGLHVWADCNDAIRESINLQLSCLRNFLRGPNMRETAASDV